MQKWLILSSKQRLLSKFPCTAFHNQNSACTSNKGCFTAFHDLPANALLFRVLCNVLHTIIVIEKVQYWYDAFLAVVGIKIHPDYFHVHMCKHNTTKSNIYLFATKVYPLHLVKVRVIYIECCCRSIDLLCSGKSQRGSRFKSGMKIRWNNCRVR